MFRDMVMNSISGRPRSPRINAAVLESARALLADVGYRTMTMEAVAARARIGKQTLYRRWSRKPLLVLAAVLGSQQDVEDQLPDLGSFAADLAAVTTQQLSVYRSPGLVELVQGLLADCLTEADLLAALRIAFIEPRLAVLERIVARAKERGEVRDDVSSHMVATVVAGAMLAAFVIFGRGDEAFASELASLTQRGTR
jgi:AcrR family transcriptional regulator